LVIFVSSVIIMSLTFLLLPLHLSLVLILSFLSFFNPFCCVSLFVFSFLFSRLAMVSFYKNLPALPPGSGVFVVVSAETGAPLGIFQENRFMTDLRTGAAGGVSLKYCSSMDPAHDKVGFIGCGAIARNMARAASEVRQVKLCFSCRSLVVVLSHLSPSHFHFPFYLPLLSVVAGVLLLATAAADLAVCWSNSRRIFV